MGAGPSQQADAKKILDNTIGYETSFYASGGYDIKIFLILCKDSQSAKDFVQLVQKSVQTLTGEQQKIAYNTFTMVRSANFIGVIDTRHDLRKGYFTIEFKFEDNDVNLIKG